jgi:hypothetical protein
MTLSDCADAPVIGQFCKRLILRQERHGCWNESNVWLHAPSLLNLPDELQAAGYQGSICKPPSPYDALLLMHCPFGHERAPFKPLLAGMPCLTKECNVELFFEDQRTGLEIKPPLAYYCSDPIPERPMLELVSPTGYNYKLQIQSFDSDDEDREAYITRQGRWLLVRQVVVDEDPEVIERRAQKLPKEDEMMIRGTLINMSPWDDIVSNAIAKAGAASRRITIEAMSDAYADLFDVLRIQAAFRSLKCRKEVLWNPNTQAGRRRVLLTWKRWLRDDADADTPLRLRPAMMNMLQTTWSAADLQACGIVAVAD